MKTKEDIQAKIQALKIKLDLAIKERDDTSNNLTYVVRNKDVIAISDQIYLLEWVLEN